MIQRIQSIWLLLATILFGLEGFLNLRFARSEVAGLAPLDDMNLYTQENNLLWAASLSSALLSFLAILMFKKRDSQFFFASFAGLVQIGLYLIAGFYLLQQAGVFSSFKPDLGVYCGVFGAICNWLATRAIRKDMALVKSMDRLR